MRRRPHADPWTGRTSLICLLFSIILQGTLALNDNYTLTYVGANLTITNLLYYFPIIFR